MLFTAAGDGAFAGKKKTKESTTPQCVTYEQVNYKQLASESFAPDFVGKCVEFEARIFGEWSEISAYQLVGTNTKNRVFINHRDASFEAGGSPFGGGAVPGDFPPFPMSVGKADSMWVFEWVPGPLCLVRGNVLFSGKNKKRKSSGGYTVEGANLTGFGAIHVLIDKIEKLDPNK